VRSLLALAAFFVFALPCAAPAAGISVVNGVQIITGNDPVAASIPRRSAVRAATRHTSTAQAAPVAAGASPLAYSVIKNALALLGTPYVWGGSSPGGFDCSGFTQYVFARSGIRIPRTADIQFAVGRPIAGYPEPGDLVFFQTYEVGASHVGIYLGNGWFVQEIRPNVHLSNFNSAYFRMRYLGARRLLPS
jgi:cell wall-associated NlpC family hydrolase